MYRTWINLFCPLKARLNCIVQIPEHEDFETIVQDVFLGTIPYMTPSGTFVINGAERMLYLNYTVHPVYSLDNLSTPMVPNSIRQELFLLKVHGSNLQQTSTM